MAQKIIIDTDPGHDDAMALMLACKSPELEVLAVTTVCGNSTIEKVSLRRMGSSIKIRQ
ncbi:MAG TPA: nucleoside hydrolase [Candidatus Saccharimonadales bacterium]|jgi:inosine-uridine nucleoside N-ribohydrolase|nr:nucleoside hydrolase [Candidatus Saccharimonadales bacterium]